jgi:ankyrin repeat protein
MKNSITILLLILIVSCWSSISYSDDSILNDYGKTVAPTKSNEISMVEEEVIISRTTYGGIHVKCIFLFNNTSEKLINATVGFPGNEYFTEHPSNPLTDFVTVIDGQRLNIKTKNEIVEETKNDNPPMFRNWYLWEMKFPPKSTLKVENTYTCGLSVAQLYGPNYLDYELSTGANWKGKIGKAIIKVIYDSVEELENNVCGINPKGWVRKQNEIIWEFKDIEPTEDDNVEICERGDNSGNPTIKQRPLLFKKEEAIPQTSDDKLFQAAQNSDLPAITTALNHGANINLNNTKYGKTALHIASQNGLVDVVNILVDKGADLNVRDLQHGATALVMALLNDHSDIARLLLDKGADVSIKDSDGNTALMIATMHGHADIVKLLLDKGADTNVKDKDGNTALMIALMHGYADIAKLLMNKGVDVNIKDNNGNTALMITTMHGHADIVKLLLDRGADINANDVDGATTLIIASMNGYADIVKLLIDRGADVNVKDTKYERTALMAASWNGHSDIVEMLKKAGVKE